MRLREIFRFELLYQARLVRTWCYFAVLLVFGFQLMRTSGGSTGALATLPSDIAVDTVICNLLWVLAASAIAGSAASRDVQTRMYPLVYTTPVSNADYIVGRFLAAFTLNALVLLMVPMGMLLAVLIQGAEPGTLSPFRPASYLSAYFILAVPTAFTVSEIQFSLAALSRRAVMSYVGSVLLVILVSIISGFTINVLQSPMVGRLFDPTGYMTVIGTVSKIWTPIEKRTLLIGLQGWMLANRAVWVAIGLAALTLTHRGFRHVR